MGFEKIFSFKNAILVFLISFLFVFSFIYFPSNKVGAACLVNDSIALNSERPGTSIIVGTNLYVLGIEEVSVIDTTSDTLIDTINIGGLVNLAPASKNLQIVGNNLYVVNYGSGNVNIIDITTNTLVGSIDVGIYPMGVALVGTDLYVTNSGSDNVSVIDTNTNTVTDTISVGDSPHDIILVGSDIYVANLISENVSVIDTNTNTVTDTVAVGGKASLFFLFGTDLYVADYIYIGTSSVGIIDTLNNTLVNTLSFSGSVSHFNTNGSFIYAIKRVHAIEIIDPITRTSVNNIDLSPSALSPGHSIIIGNNLYVAALGSDSVSVIDINTNNVVDNISVETEPIFMTLVGEYLYVSNFRSDSISVIDTNTNELLETCTPELVSAEINSNIITLTYDEILDISSVPDVDSFFVTIDGSQVTVISVEILDDKVILVTSIPANYGDLVTLSYVIPAQNPTQNLSGVKASPITDQIVLNNTTSCAIISVGSSPYSGTLVGDNLYVNNLSSESISVINTLNYNVIDTIDVGINPFYSVLVGTDLYVFAYGAETVIVDTLTNTVTNGLSAGSESYIWGTLVGNSLYINNIDTNEVHVLDTLSNTIGDIIAVGPIPYSSTLVGIYLYVFNAGGDTVSVIDTTTNTVSETITVGVGPYSGTLVGNYLYVNNYSDTILSVVDITTNTVYENINLTSGPQFSVAIEGMLYVSQPDENAISVIDTSTNTIIDKLIMVFDDQGVPTFLNLVNGKIYVSNGVSNIYIIDPNTNSLYSCPTIFNLNYMAGPNGFIEGDTFQTLEAGEDGTPVTAVPNEGYEFSGWSDNIDDNPRTDFNVADNISVTANFMLISSDDSITRISNGGGTTVYGRFRNLVNMGKLNEAYSLVDKFSHMFKSEKNSEYGFCDNATFIDFMKMKDKDGQYSAYNRGEVKEVSKLQTFINKLFISQYTQASGPIDGIFGPLTKLGVKRLQNLLNGSMNLQNDLVVDGIVGPYTRSAINNFCLPDNFQI